MSLLIPQAGSVPFSKELTSVADSAFSARAQALFKQYARQSSAYFVFQDGVEYFFASRGGMVSYALQPTPFGPCRIVFTNPLCAPSDMHATLVEFLADSQIPAVFASVDAEAAEVLRTIGFSINQIGEESRFRLNEFDVVGHKKKQLRHASNFGVRTGCHVEELVWGDVDTQRVESISRSWLRSKRVNTRELRLATRPPVFDDEWGVRKFFCKRGDTILAFVYFDPYYHNGQLKGYCANILRSIPSKRYSSALDFTILEAIKTFKREGVPEVSLGVAPMSNIQPDPDENILMRKVAECFYRYGNFLYAFKGLAYHKSRYRPQTEAWYLCTRDTRTLRTYWALTFGLKVLGKVEF